jgi:intron-binding protein aquarius
LIGYPKDRITIITTHESQRDLINDVLERRCANPLFSIPRVSTVDTTESNDYVLLSLVRTTDTQHVRSLPLVYHMFTRARLGLYVFCRSNIYEDTPELVDIWNKFGGAKELSLCTEERFGDVERRQGTTIKIKDVVEIGRLVHGMAQDKIRELQAKKQQKQDEMDEEQD